jgi:hypothetical protein
MAISPSTDKSASAPEPCDCLSTVNAMLAERNTRLMIPIMFGADQTPRVMIETEQVERGRGKPRAVAMFATFCSFYGVRYSAPNA